VLLAVEHVTIMVRPFAAQSAFGCALEGEHWSAPTFSARSQHSHCNARPKLPDRYINYELGGLAEIAERFRWVGASTSVYWSVSLPSRGGRLIKQEGAQGLLARFLWLSSTL
jgi:hypothetical protein